MPQHDTGPSGPLSLFGLHAAEAALRNPRRSIRNAFLTENAARRLQPALAARDVRAQIVRPRELDKRLGPDTVHQGALLEVEPLPNVDLAAVIADPETGGPIVVLDQVTDPHNVGAVLRSAAVFGACALVLTHRHSPPLGGALAKAASGALDLVPIALVQNLSRTLIDLKERRVSCVGLDGAAAMLIEDAPLGGRIALVLGAEGRGLRERTRLTCDQLCRIGTPGLISSLNVSNAAAVALHVASMRRKQGSGEA